MALPTFTPVRPPRPGTAVKPEIKLWKTEFGDGYTQAAPAGLNHIRKTLTLNWDLLTPSEANAMTGFLTERGGYKPFYYTPSDDTDSIKWTCEDWEDKRADSGMREVSMTFKQCFGLYED